MICGGTGITPMIQALHAILGTTDDTTSVTLLYGSTSSDNILAGCELDSWASKSEGRFKLVHTLSREADDSSWAGERGHVSKELIEAHLPSPADDVMIFVCGPVCSPAFVYFEVFVCLSDLSPSQPSMYESLCGPRTEKNVSGVLSDLGYTSEQVFKF